MNDQQQPAAEPEAIEYVGIYVEGLKLSGTDEDLAIQVAPRTADRIVITLETLRWVLSDLRNAGVRL